MSLGWIGFAQAVIVVEADGDRAVYQATLETLLPELRVDIHFSTVGGTGGIADTARLYRTLRIPIAVVADLDMIVDVDKMTKVLAALVTDPSARDQLTATCRQVAERIRSVPPEASPKDVAKELQALGDARMNWDEGDDLELKKKLSGIAGAIDRMHRLKKGGVSAYPAGLAAPLTELLEGLCNVGLFLVPVGELEEWLATRGVPTSKNNKRAWANAAAQRIHELGMQPGDVWDFIARVGRYLVSSLSKSARPN